MATTDYLAANSLAAASPELFGAMQGALLHYQKKPRGLSLVRHHEAVAREHQKIMRALLKGGKNNKFGLFSTTVTALRMSEILLFSLAFIDAIPNWRKEIAELWRDLDEEVIRIGNANAKEVLSIKEGVSNSIDGIYRSRNVAPSIHFFSEFEPAWIFLESIERLLASVLASTAAPSDVQGVAATGRSLVASMQRAFRANAVNGVHAKIYDDINKSAFRGHASWLGDNLCSSLIAADAKLWGDAQTNSDTMLDAFADLSRCKTADLVFLVSIRVAKADSVISPGELDAIRAFSPHLHLRDLNALLRNAKLATQSNRELARAIAAVCSVRDLREVYGKLQVIAAVDPDIVGPAKGEVLWTDVKDDPVDRDYGKKALLTLLRSEWRIDP